MILISKEASSFSCPTFMAIMFILYFFLLMHVYIYIWHLTGFHENLLDDI
jgi:hypothetical protein